MNVLAYKCTKCSTISYSNTSRRVPMRCLMCGKFSMIRSAKDDR